MEDKLLVVTTEPALSDALEAEFDTVSVSSPEAARAELEGTRFAAVVADGDFADFVSELRTADDTLGAVVIADDGAALLGTLDPSVDIVERPCSPLMLRRRVNAALARRRAEQQARVMSQLLHDVNTEIELTGRSPAIAHAREQIRLAAGTDANVLVVGEPGTGRESAAQRIHRMSDRSARPLVKAFCSVVPSEIMERELFGNENGTPGKLHMAVDGTLLVEEVAELSEAAQRRLLDALRGVHSGVRVIATTRHDLRSLARDGRFDRELLYLLDVLMVEMPPLRDRRADIPALAWRFVEYVAARAGRSGMTLDPDALDTIVAAPWRGNVRQLQNIIERAVILATGDAVSAEHVRVGNGESDETIAGEVERTFRSGSIREMEKLMIIQRLRDNDDNRTRSAESLQISVRTLRNKLNEYNLGRRSPATQIAEEVSVG